DPLWWRLAVNSEEAQWHICNLRLYQDRDCLRPLSGSLVKSRSSSPALRSTYSQDTAPR
ncbi:unnamed protein product, partial [Effrenium voratum]